jgi:thiol-disulfide isomerase/thioredoxin
MNRAPGRGLLLLVFFLSLSALVGGGWGEIAFGTPGFGDFFPKYTFQSLAASDDRAYLGIADEKTFTLEDIQADLIVLEVLSTYCTSCQMQAPIYEEVAGLLEHDPLTKGRIKWIAVGVGNNEREIEAFRKENKTSFPFLPDVNFEFYHVVGGPSGVRTPLTILIRKDEKGRGIVVEAHVGFRRNKEDIFAGIKAALQYDLAYLRIKEGERRVLPVAEKLPPPLSDKELLQKVMDGMVINGGSVVEVRRTTLKDEVVYLGKVRIDSGEEQLFAKVVSRPPLCDICHDIHFIYIFDEEGKVRNFIPIHLTKYGNGNSPWSDDDVRKMKSRLIGRSLLQPFQFDRDVDAVSKATVTSVVIFDAMNKGKSTYVDLTRENFVK